MITSVHTWNRVAVHYLTVMASKEAAQNIPSVIFLSSWYAHTPRLHNASQNDGHHNANNCFF